MAFWSAVLGLGRKIPNPKGSVTITNACVTESKKGAKKGAADGDVAEVRIKTKENVLMTVCGFVPATGIRNASLNILLTAEEAGRLAYVGSSSLEVHLIGRYVEGGAEGVSSAPKANKQGKAPQLQDAVPAAKLSKSDIIKELNDGKFRIQDLLDMDAEEDSEDEEESDEAEDPEEAAILKSVDEKVKNYKNLSISRPNGNKFADDEEEEDDSDSGSDLADFIVNDDEDVGEEEDTTEDDDDDEQEKEVVPDRRTGQKSQLVNSGGPKAKVQKVNVPAISKSAAESTPKKSAAESAPRKSVAELALRKSAAAATPVKSAAKANVSITTPHKSPAPKKVVTKNGVVIEEVQSGNGPIAKRGKKVTVYYTGRLKSNNKKFDSNTSGRGFTFKLGASEVIKGWDIGVEGMKVGEHRRIQIPPNMGYGRNGAPPDIPPNAALVFDVELKNVK